VCPKWNHIPNIVHYFGAEPYGISYRPGKKKHYKETGVPFVMQSFCFPLKTTQEFRESTTATTQALNHSTCRTDREEGELGYL
jgi:hypothetical protein